MELSRENLKLLQREIGRPKAEKYGDVRIEQLLLDVNQLLVQQQEDLDSSINIADPKNNANDGTKTEGDNFSMTYESADNLNEETISILPLDQTALEGISVHHQEDVVDDILDPGDKSCLLPVRGTKNDGVETSQLQSQHPIVSATGESIKLLSSEKNSQSKAAHSCSTPSLTHYCKSKIPRSMTLIGFKIPKISTKNKVTKSQFDLKFPKF